MHFTRVDTQLLSATTAQHNVGDSPCAVCAACHFVAAPADAPVRLFVSPVLIRVLWLWVAPVICMCVCRQLLAPTVSITVHAAETTAAGSTAAGEQGD
jgi:hypothetical protein